MKSTRLVYDGSFEGLLTAIFQVYEERLQEVILVPEASNEPDFFSESISVITDEHKADRVWRGIKAFPEFRTTIYRSFLSEKPKVELAILEAVRYVLKTKNASDFGHPAVLKLAQLSREVGREKHRMEAFVRFKRTVDDTYVAVVEPDFNVLPLIARHFKKRYADQVFMIYDRKRNYGLYYDLQKMEFVTLQDFSEEGLQHVLHTQEAHFDAMWRDYFKSTGIQSRINKKLHLRHVPKRYWKYLNEKNPL